MTTRVHVFVDFWNYELTTKEVHQDEFKTDWQKLPKALAQAAAQVVSGSRPFSYEGTNVYLSFGPNDDNLRKFARGKLSQFPGVTVIGRERVSKAPSKCPSCRTPLTHCPACSQQWLATEEKGVDIQLAVDMLDMAWRQTYDVAVLVSGDKDFIPAVTAVRSHGKKVIHAGYQDSDLRNHCWGSLDMRALAPQFKRRTRRGPGDVESNESPSE